MDNSKFLTVGCTFKFMFMNHVFSYNKKTLSEFVLLI